MVIINATMDPMSSTTETDPPPTKAECEKNSQLSTEYEPHEHGNETHSTTYWDTVIHLLKAMIGKGMLALPFIIKEVGYVTGISGIIVIGALYMHVLHILISVEYELCKRLKVPNITFVNTVEHAFQTSSSRVRRIKGLALFCMYFRFVLSGILTKSMYIVIIVTNLNIVISYYTSTKVDFTVMASLVLVPLLLLSCIPNLKFLVAASAVTNVFNFINIILILCIPGLPAAKSGSIEPFGSICEFPKFFALAVGAYTCTGLILPLKSEMRHPKRFSTLFGALNVGGSIVVFIYTLFGFVAYFKYGNKTQPNILENLPPDQFLSLLVLTLYSFSMVVSFILYLYVTFDTIWANCLEKKMEKNKSASFVKFGLRTGITLITYLITIGLPNFELIAALGGTIAIIIDIGMAPALNILVLISAPKKRKHFYFIIVKDVLIIIFTLFLFVVGLTQVIQRIIKFYRFSVS